MHVNWLNDSTYNIKKIIHGSIMDYSKLFECDIEYNSSKLI